MPILATKTELKCKLCSHPERTEIDRLIELRSRRELNLEGLLAKMRELQVTNPTKENVTLHLRKHCQIVTEEEFEAQQKQKADLTTKVAEICEKEFGAGWQDRILTNDEYLIFVRICSQYDLWLKVQNGEKTGATIDHGLKAVGEGTKRKSSEAEDEMKKGIGHALQAFAEQSRALSDTRNLDNGHTRPALNAGEFEAEEIVVADGE